MGKFVATGKNFTADSGKFIVTHPNTSPTVAISSLPAGNSLSKPKITLLEPSDSLSPSANPLLPCQFHGWRPNFIVRAQIPLVLAKMLHFPLPSAHGKRRRCSNFAPNRTHFPKCCRQTKKRIDKDQRFIKPPPARWPSVPPLSAKIASQQKTRWRNPPITTGRLKPSCPKIPPPPPPHRPTGYFNQAQLEDITEAEDLLAAITPERSPLLAKRRITADYTTGLAAAVALARRKSSDAAAAGDDSEASTLLATGAERVLLVALQGIQSSAKQLRRMLAEDDDPTTHFSTEGYLIGQRLNRNRATLLQNADILLGKARTDDLPGYDAAGIQAVEDALKDYRDDRSSQQKAGELSETERIARDTLIRKINSRRQAIQHAADALWPYTDKTARPIRKAFHLPLNRPLNP